MCKYLGILSWLHMGYGIEQESQSRLGATYREGQGAIEQDGKFLLLSYF
jgi:hypothetical protein